MESYKHKFAKKVVADWMGSPGWLRYGGLPGLTVKEGGVFKAFEEYPVALDSENELRGLCPYWDKAGPPSYQALLDRELLPIAVFDVALFHHGPGGTPQLGVAIEIVHTNDISDTKLAYIRRIATELPFLKVYTVDADWVLSRSYAPEKLVYETVHQFGHL